MSSLKHKTISGIKWTFAVSIVQRIVSFGTTVILARILSPADFGLFALAFVMIDGFGIFKSLGFDSALVRRKGDNIEKACNTAFFLIPAMGMILFTVLFFFAPIGAQFFNNPQVAPLIRTIAIVFVISTFGKVPQTILYRDMKFKYKSIGEVAASVTYAFIALVLALNKFGVWSLVIAYIAKTLVQVSIEWYFSGWKPRFEFDKTIAWDMFHFGKYVLASGIISFLYSNLDNIVVGKFLGVAMLGFYAISLNISNFLGDYLLGRVGFIMFPAYSKIQEDPYDVRRVMLKTLKYVSILVFPFTFGLFAFAPDILRLVFGEKWLPATNILRILCFVGLFRCLGTTIWPIFMAKGQSKTDFQISAIQVGLFFVLIVPLAIKFKLIGVGIAVLLSNLVSFIIGIIRIKKIVFIGFRQVFASLRPAMLAAIFMLIAAIFLRSLSFTNIANENFIISGLTSLFVYMTAIYLMNRNIFKEIKEVFV
jgi:O-antigen/teichoic acid export membrane protein